MHTANTHVNFSFSIAHNILQNNTLKSIVSGLLRFFYLYHVLIAWLLVVRCSATSNECERLKQIHFTYLLSNDKMFPIHFFALAVKTTQNTPMM